MNKSMIIQGQTPFGVTKHNFMVGVCADSYKLQVSVDYDGEGDPADFTWSDYSDTIPAADGPLEVGPVASNLWWRLYGNTREVKLRY